MSIDPKTGKNVTKNVVVKQDGRPSYLKLTDKKILNHKIDEIEEFWKKKKENEREGTDEEKKEWLDELNKEITSERKLVIREKRQ